MLVFGVPAMKSKKNEVGRRAEIRQFLMARRAAITPESAGLPSGMRRRTPGLRREELAVLAGIGVTWYTWFEQGRDIRVSAAALKRVATALRLGPSDSEYLFLLCGIPRLEVANEHAGQLDDCVLNVLDAIQDAPAFVMHPRGHILAYNPLADSVFEFEAYDGPFADNHHWRFFMDPKRRARYLDWQDFAKHYVAWIRLAQGKMPGDAYFGLLIQELYAGSDVFRGLWDAQVTGQLESTISVGFKLPRFGAVHFNSVRFILAGSQPLLLVLTAADEKTTRAMTKLSEKLRTQPGRQARSRRSVNRG
jgi:transcriptional regulator with XRE-family HTH domain